ncbi:hypothetical protein I33_1480 [Bacillus subtilis subsp. subtilis str. RO-NN-1]|nr:hypothetical protein I33_1480 [Bacillus subtilis subsp. subtilis str. RO-NN-1]
MTGILSVLRMFFGVGAGVIFSRSETCLINGFRLIYIMN